MIFKLKIIKAICAILLLVKLADAQDKLPEVKYSVLWSNVDLRGFIDVFLTLGGDGTLLDMVTVIRDSGIPVIGINFGRLGFLASVNKNDITAAAIVIKVKFKNIIMKNPVSYI